METFAVRHLSFTYPRGDRPALEDVSLTVPQGAFLVLCGPSGCGKSTLLRHLKPALAPTGDRRGEILFEGEALESLSPRDQAGRIGFVLQSPENQLVTDKVWHELAFGLESLGWDTPTIRRRVAEMASFFGIQDWFYRDVADLSGGQKQLLNLASILAMGPGVLILDEPTSQLDPIAAGDFLAALGRINRELGTTVILTEHRLEEALPLATAVAVMEEGRVLTAGTPREVGAALRARDHGMFLAMPAPMRVWAAAPDAGGECPVTVREGRDWLEGYAARHPLRDLPPEPVRPRGEETVLRGEELWFRYGKEGPDVVRGLSLAVRRGEFLALLGGNGTGKTTALRLLAGLLKPLRGRVEARGRVGVLPQDPQSLFVKSSVREELLEMVEGAPDGGERMARAAALCRLEGLLDRHPYDLSGGEQQRAALAKVLLYEPDILLLDEPTKGLDGAYKAVFAGLIEDLLATGRTVVMVSHDVEFCAQYAHRCALFFDGGVVTEGAPREFFSGNSFYTTAVNRMARALAPRAVTVGDGAAVCGGALPPPPRPEVPRREPEPEPEPAQRREGSRLPLWRKFLAAVWGALAGVLLLHFLNVLSLTGLLARLGVTNGALRQTVLYSAFAGALVALGLTLGRRRAPPPPRAVRGKLPRRTIVGACLAVLLIPATLALGVTVWPEEYYLTALLILLECIAPFLLVFEGRRPQARELVLLAVLCALGVAGRQVFFMLPEFKPVLAITVVSGVALGGESGFLVGAMTMLVSNMLFSQGPWTPWQMFSMGLVGFLAGVLFRRRGRSRVPLCVFGAAASVVVYGGILNFQSALTWSRSLDWQVLAAYYASGFPMDCVHAAATWVFLWFGGEAMLDKLDRVREKYGLNG